MTDNEGESVEYYRAVEGGEDQINFIVTQSKSLVAFHRQKRSHYTSSKLAV